MRVVAMQRFTDSHGNSAVLIRTSDVVGVDRKQRDRNVVDQVNGEHVMLRAWHGHGEPLLTAGPCLDVTSAEPLGVHMSDMLEFLDTGFLTAPKVDVDPLHRQISTPSTKAKVKGLPKSDPSTWWVYTQHSATGNKENKPRTHRRVTPAERKAALALQSVPITAKIKVSPRSKSPNDSKAKSPHETNPKPKSLNDSKAKTPDDGRQTTPTPSSKSRKNKLDQTLRTGNTPPGGVGPGRWPCLLGEG